MGPTSGGLVAAAVSAGGLAVTVLTVGTEWLSATVAVPVGWLVIGPLVLLFTPALAIVTAISRRLGLKIDVKNR